MLKKEIALENMKHLVNHNWHGYSQISRWGDGDGVCVVDFGGAHSELAQGDRDCSSAIISAYEAAGISCGGATYTGNMREKMCATGNFRWHPMSSWYVAQAGDVYLNEACHTAMCLSAQPDMLMEFSMSETGGVDGAEGDQTGWESHTCAYYNYPWDGILECINAEVVNTSVCWILDSVGWWYKNPDGSYPRNCWKELDAWYYFNASGYAVREQWLKDNGKWHYMKKDCRMAKSEWQLIKGYWYYFDENGVASKGWEKIKGTWYFFMDKEGTAPECSAVRGWFTDNGYTYYALPKKTGTLLECAVVSGWFRIDNEWYYFNEDKNCQPVCSMMRNHWVNHKGKKYYLKDSGKMAHGEKIQIGGKQYRFNDNGTLI